MAEPFECDAAEVPYAPRVWTVNVVAVVAEYRIVSESITMVPDDGKPAVDPTGEREPEPGLLDDTPVWVYKMVVVAINVVDCPTFTAAPLLCQLATDP